MEQSIYAQWIDKYFRGVAIRTIETLNGKNNEQALTYMFKTMLRKEQAPSGKWESINVLNTRVSADYVAMDSSLPLKRRDSIGKVTGDIVKSGMELWLNEKQLSELDVLISQRTSYGGNEADIISKLFQDTVKVITGIYELMEKSFLEGLSTGVTVVDDAEPENKIAGIGVRLDYGYLGENKFGVSKLWSDTSSTPLTDIREALRKAKADGNTVTYVYMDDVTFENFARTQQVKEYFAFSIGFIGQSAIVPAPTLEKINTALKGDNRYKFQIAVVDRRIITENNGKRTVVTPWSEGKVILTSTQQVGVLPWTRVAEQNHPKTGVAYQTVDDYILISKFRSNRPSIAEYTTSQARVVPVICNVDQIYSIDAKTLQA